MDTLSLFRITVVLAVASVFVACGSSGQDRDKSLIGRYSVAENTAPDPVPIARLDRDIQNYINLGSDARAAFIQSQYRRLNGFGEIVGDSVSDSSVALWSTWPATTMFMPEVEKIYTDLKAEEAALGRILSVARRNNLSVGARDFVAVTWGKPQSIIFNDSIMYLALNHYLGPLNEAYNGWPEYKRRLKTRDMIPVDMAEAIVATAYPYGPTGDDTVLSRLLYNGAMAVAKQAMVPDASLSAILGFTPEQLADIQANESTMWQRLVSNDMLYSTDAGVHDDLFSQKAQSTSISPDAPGRAVRLIGYRIVMDYLAANPDTKLSDLLSPDFYSNAQSVLKSSGYPGK